MIRPLNLIAIHDGILSLLRCLAGFVLRNNSLDVGVVLMAIGILKILAEHSEPFSIDRLDHIAGFVVAGRLLREHVEVLLNLKLIVGRAWPLVARCIIDDLIDKVNLCVISTGLSVQAVTPGTEAFSMLDFG